MAGVIRRERLQRFEQVLWRACRGNVYVQQAEINDPIEDPSTVSSSGEIVDVCTFACVCMYVYILGQ